MLQISPEKYCNATGNFPLISQGQISKINESVIYNVSNSSYISLFYNLGPGNSYQLINGKLILVHVYTVEELMPYLILITLTISLVLGLGGYFVIGPRLGKILKNRKEGAKS